MRGGRRPSRHWLRADGQRGLNQRVEQAPERRVGHGVQPAAPQPAAVQRTALQRTALQRTALQQVLARRLHQGRVRHRQPEDGAQRAAQAGGHRIGDPRPGGDLQQQIPGRRSAGARGAYRCLLGDGIADQLDQVAGPQPRHPGNQIHVADAHRMEIRHAGGAQRRQYARRTPVADRVPKPDLNPHLAAATVADRPRRGHPCALVPDRRANRLLILHLTP